MIPTETRSISDLLMELHRQGWTDAALAEEFGVTIPTVWRWRTGARQPDVDKLVRSACLALLHSEKAEAPGQED